MHLLLFFLVVLAVVIDAAAASALLPTHPTGYLKQQETCKRVNIKLFGERNSGTNFLTELLGKNFNALGWKVLQGTAKTQPADEYFKKTYEENLGWKHQFVRGDALRTIVESDRNADDCFFFVAVNKDPYAWLISMYNKPYHYGAPKSSIGTFSDFVRKPYGKAGSREFATAAIGNKQSFDNPIEIYNVKHWSHLQLQLPKVVLRYKDILVDQKAAMQAIYDAIVQQFPSLEQKRPFQPSALASTVKVQGRTKPEGFYTDKYVHESWRDTYVQHPGLLDFINVHLDMELLKKLHYEVISDSHLHPA